jgi:hypothetical protein
MTSSNMQNKPVSMSCQYFTCYMAKKGYDNGIGVMSAEERMAAYENGIGAMLAEARMAASEKGYENGLGAMSAKERMAASAKSMLAAGIEWEKKCAEFKRCVEMPERGTPLHTWQKTQLGNGHASLNAKIRKELAENKGSTIWSE